MGPLGVMTRIMTALTHELRARGAIDVREAFIDASLAPARRGLQGRQNETRQGYRSWRSRIVIACREIRALIAYEREKRFSFLQASRLHRRQRTNRLSPLCSITEFSALIK
jgi:hypothetical protein